MSALSASSVDQQTKAKQAYCLMFAMKLITRGMKNMCRHRERERQSGDGAGQGNIYVECGV